MGRRRQDPVRRFFAKVDTHGENGCWNWTAGLDNHGYGKFHVTGETTMAKAHRWAYEFMCGPIEPGLVLDHLCRNTKCVNPQHLEPVTQRENLVRGTGFSSRALWTHCARGHEFTAENTGRDSRNNGRYCKACRRLINSKAYRQAKLERVSS